MNKIFSDTSGWGHLIDSNQKYHKLATNIYRDSRNKGIKIVTTNYVITELVALLLSPLRIHYSVITEFINCMKVSPHIEIIHIDPSLDEQTWQLFSKRADKGWSLIDCSSFVVMQKLGITESFTTDHHFEQAGFIRLLK
ncbi:MAG: PIN domain-containing protein [Desulfobacterales bacterium]